MADIITIIFSFVALTCGMITLYWLLKLKRELALDGHNNYVTSAMIAISFLVSFPLWNLFIDIFSFTSTVVRQVSYLFFSAGYFGVLIVAHLSVKSVQEMKGKVKNLDKVVKRRKSIRNWANKKV